MILLSALLACAAPPAPAGPRVLSLHDTTTEIVVGLGHAADLVAITEPRFLSPAAERAVAGVPRLPTGPLSAEAILALRPTLILGTDVVPEQQPELEGLPGAVWIDPADLGALWTTIAEVAAAIGADPVPYTSSLQAMLPPVVQVDVPRRVWIYDCCDPPFTLGGRGPLNEILGRLGARNIFADLDADWATVGWEAAAAARPELVVVHDYTWEGQAALAGKVQTLHAAPGLADVPTVTLPLALSLEGPRVVEAAAVLGPALEAL